MQLKNNIKIVAFKSTNEDRSSKQRHYRCGILLKIIAKHNFRDITSKKSNPSCNGQTKGDKIATQ